MRCPGAGEATYDDLSPSRKLYEAAYETVS